MIQTIEVTYLDWIEHSRKTWKKHWMSSVEASKKYDTKHLRKFCDISLHFHAIRFIIGNTIKYWFHRDTVTNVGYACLKNKEKK